MSEIKQGMLKYYHRGLLHKKWKDYKFILYDSSLLTWYADVKHKKPDGMVLLKDVERFICVGPFTRFLPDFPHLDNEYDQVTLIAFPMSIKNRDRDIVWLLCDDINDLNSWMKAIIQTLPSHTLSMERLPNASSPLIEENMPISSEMNSPEINCTEPLVLKTGGVGLPLVAGLIGSRLQGSAMNSKEHPLKKAGYDYGDTMWGTGEGWGYFSPLDVPGYAAIGGSGCYSNHIDLIRNENDEEHLKDVEDRIGGCIDAEEAVEQATYELKKNQYEDKEEESADRDDESESDDDKDKRSDKDIDDDDDLYERMKEDLQMIDSDGEK